MDEFDSCALEIHALSHGPAFFVGVMRTLRRLVSTPFAIYGHTDLANGVTNMGLRYPEQIDLARWVPVFDAHFWEHPLNGRASKIGVGQVTTMAQLVSAREWRMSGNFNEFCRPNGIEYQLMIRLPSARGIMEAIGIARSDRDFTDEERARVGRLKEHILIAHRRARLLASDDDISGPNGLSAWRLGHVVADDRGLPLVVDERAAQLFGAFFRRRVATNLTTVPDEVLSWLRATLKELPSRAPKEFTQRRSAGRGVLRAWMVPVPGTGRCDVYLREEVRDNSLLIHRVSGGQSQEDLTMQLERVATRWGLTPRQRKTMQLVATGMTNKEIANAVGCAEVTVEYHVTSLLRRAGASNRTMLVSRFWSES